MRRTIQRSLFTLAAAGLLAVPAIPTAVSAADDSAASSISDGAKSAGETMKNGAESAGSAVKDGAESAGSAVKNGAKGAAGYVSDTAKNAATRLSGKDSLFVRKAAIGDLAEVKSAELAKSKTSSSAVKEFAEQMITDHTKATEELTTIAKEKDITVPTELDNEHQAKLDKLAGLSGDAFDRAYAKQQKIGHETMLRLLDDEAKNGKDADLKSFAAKTKTVVEEHHAKAQKLTARERVQTSRSE